MNTSYTQMSKRNANRRIIIVSRNYTCGLLLNELLTKCFKHACPDQAEGTINLRMTKSGSTIHLIVEENGIGLPPNFNIAQESSLGMNLITTLILQIDGDLKVSSDGGSRFEIVFEVEE